MKTIMILCAFVIFVIVQIQCQEDGCGPHERRVECKSCCKVPTCQQKVPPKCNRICLQVCFPGCECLPGYIRLRENGPCVKTC
ncbi:chymotrypsin inhibitor Ani s 6-like [Diabrotica virgifera virgifera]|uniref:Chymotrypsin inhibitor-like n=1 Tax=Diabrotica virgifera virgifera TaxID=50390 RepID=A0ABM5IID4_DIAVI|nr:chymotrypsin inhibitor Ani s 6-like [Diabrotica virgifera virgifera]